LRASRGGNWLGGRIADRTPTRDSLSSSLFWCGLFTLLIIVLFALGTRFQNQLDSGIEWLLGRGVAEEGGEVSPPTALQGYLLPVKIITYAAALFYLPMVAFGTVSPQVTRLAVRDWDHAGRVAGRVYAWSCAGAIGGTFAAGWLLIGQFGVLAVVLAIAAVMIVLALVVGANWHKPMELLGTALVLGAVLVAAWAGRDNYLALKRGDEIVYYKETNYYLISVRKRDEADGPPDTQRDFVLDHLIHSHVKGGWARRDGLPVWEADVTYLGYGHEQVQTEFARRASALAGGAPNVLVIGGGGYTLPRWVDHELPKANVEVVEIDPGVTRAVYDALGLSRDTRIRTHNLDGRQFVQELAPPGHYHLVIQDAVNDLSVPYHIMTREYNDAVRRSLADDGVYLLTVIDEYPNGKLLPAAIRTMQATFPNVSLLAESAYWDDKPRRNVYVITGSARPVDYAALKAVLEKQGITEMKTTVMPAEKLTAYLEAAGPVLLTDDYAPVDNLIAETFRRR